VVIGYEARQVGKRAGIAIVVMAALCMAVFLCGCQSKEESISSSTVGLASETTSRVDSASAPVPVSVTAAAPESESVSVTVEPVSQSTSVAVAKSGSGKVVAIDPGHQAQGDSSQEPIGPGSSETKYRVSDGAAGVVTNVDESAVNLAVSFKPRDLLEAQGVTVVMTRETQDINISNSERAEIANNANADLFVRIHCDGVDSSSISGILMLVPGENEWTGPIVAKSAVAGALIQDALLRETGANDRGIVERTDLSGFNWCTVPTVLPELGCMSNPTEDELLSTDSYQQTLAQALCDGIMAYLAQE